MAIIQVKHNYRVSIKSFPDYKYLLCYIIYIYYAI